jgi:hypothetical protein
MSPAPPVLASLNEAKAKAAKLSPSDGGKKVTRLFDQYFQAAWTES